jgi:hypothetical protein
MLVCRLDDAPLWLRWRLSRQRLSRFKSQIARFPQPIDPASNDAAAFAKLESHVGEARAGGPQLGQLVADGHDSPVAFW